MAVRRLIKNMTVRVTEAIPVVASFRHISRDFLIPQIVTTSLPRLFFRKVRYPSESGRIRAKKIRSEKRSVDCPSG